MITRNGPLSVQCRTLRENCDFAFFSLYFPPFLLVSRRIRGISWLHRSGRDVRIEVSFILRLVFQSLLPEKVLRTCHSSPFCHPCRDRPPPLSIRKRNLQNWSPRQVLPNKTDWLSRISCQLYDPAMPLFSLRKILFLPKKWIKFSFE